MATRKKNSVFDDDNDGSDIRVHQNPNKEVMETPVSNDVKPPIEQNVVQNNVQPPQEEVQNTSFNPLDGEVKKREYATNFGSTNEPTIERVPEPPINNLPPPPPPPPPADKPQQSPYEKPLNPDMVNLPPKDQKVASTMMVDAILSGYKQFWGLASDWVSVSDEQIIEWVMQDKISLDITVPINDKGEEATLRDVYNIYNTQAKSALTVTDAFVDSVRESMIREFTRRGWGLSDMQNIIQAFVRDAGAKGIAVYQLKATMNNFTKGIMKQHDEYKKLREELTKVKEKVAPSEPTVIRKNSNAQQQPTASENGRAEKEPLKRDTVKEAREFLTKYEIVPNSEPPIHEEQPTTYVRDTKEEEYTEAEVHNVEPEIREVPVYEGEKDIQPEVKAETILDIDQDAETKK